MPGIDKLPIEETLEDSPQTRSLLGVFEEDATAISNYMNQLYQAMHRIYDAQNELSAATHLTSKLLKEYEKQRFPLGGDDEVMSSTLQQFSKVIDELSSCHAVLSTQLADAMMFPITQFKERDLKGIEVKGFKTGLVSSTWDRQFYFTQGGNLMSQARGDVAGGLAMDIDNCSVMAVDCEDRRYCFQITSFDGKKSSILQAESKKDHEEWICTINNISKQIYLSENPEETAARVNQSALEAVTPSPSFQQRHESLRPAGRTNPFGESGGSTKSETEDSILHQLFIVRFLGSMEVKSDDHPDVVYETMRQILAARAIHNIFRMTESHLLVTCDCLKLIDPQTQVTRLTFPLPCVVLYATHQENKRLFGFVLRTSGGRSESNLSSVCYIFESNNEGEKICDSVGLAKQIALHAELDRRASEKQKEIERVKEKQQKELNKQKQIEKDLEEQSRLIAASSRTNQASSEGQFVVLSSSQSEESDLGEEGQKRESEA
ncbi:Hypothetical predicted protein [Marmota monax]|uniref:PID domain-containing protein n=1 Tax=Marmota monax TaxID=9995 RepID=A0A5E4B4T7_MARMO|nr:Hypothetical predicted protein [Marmota monax]